MWVASSYHPCHASAGGSSVLWQPHGAQLRFTVPGRTLPVRAEQVQITAPCAAHGTPRVWLNSTAGLRGPGLAEAAVLVLGMRTEGRQY